MKNWKTTLLGALAALAVALKPVLDGSGYNFDTKTIAELTFAAILALNGYVAKDREEK